jgi:threonine/homoserine/homoserine lactone efflux protein
MSSQLISLLLFGIAASLSPGPNNIMTSYTAFNFGIKKTIPTMLGVVIGWTLLVILLQIGSLAVFQKFEIIQKMVRFFGSIYLIYMAYKISFSSIKSEKLSPKPVTFLNTFFFNLLIPKA